MGQLLAGLFDHMAADFDRFALVEIGAGRGVLARHILEHRHFPYVIVEQSTAMKAVSRKLSRGTGSSGGTGFQTLSTAASFQMSSSMLSRYEGSYAVGGGFAKSSWGRVFAKSRRIRKFHSTSRCWRKARLVRSASKHASGSGGSRGRSIGVTIWLSTTATFAGNSLPARGEP